MRNKKATPNKSQQAADRKIQEKIISLFSIGNWPSLEAESIKFIEKYPRNVFGYKALITSLIQTDRSPEALEILSETLKRFPNDSELLNNQAAALIKIGQFEAAIDSAKLAISIDPNNGGAHANLGLAHKKLGAWAQAINAYRRAIEINENDYISLNNAGIALLEAENPELAISCFQAALEINPKYHDALENIAIANEDLKLLRNARIEIEKILSTNPEHDAARSRYIQILRTDCLFSESEEQEKLIVERLHIKSNTSNILPFSLLSVEACGSVEQMLAGDRHANHKFSDFLRRQPLVDNKVGSVESRRIRIGYLSADFHEHATLMLMIRILEKHNHEKFDIYLYSYGVDDQSLLRKRAISSADVFRNIKPLSHTEAAELIVQDGIDILVDLKGYTKDERLAICALRPAPIIVSWLGYPGTLGHERLADYIIGDPITTPLTHAKYYTETLALMPDCYQPNDDSKLNYAPPTRSSLNLPENSLVFCSFNQAYKITRRVFSQWCRLLTNVPDSVLWLLADNNNSVENLKKLATDFGIEANRLIFAEKLPIEEHRKRLQQADLALDTYPYSSHTTGSDALWAGVPLISICGDTFASRVSSSLLNSIGLRELISNSPEHACDLAIALSKEKNKLQNIKELINKNKYTSPLFNSELFTRNLERLYIEMCKQNNSGTKRCIQLTHNSSSATRF